MPKGTLTARAKPKPSPEAAAPIEASTTVAPAKPASTKTKASAKPAPSSTSVAHRSGNLQDQFLNHLRREKAPITMFLVKGVKLQGIVTWFDNFSILLRRDGQSQLVYKHAISTIMPSAPIDSQHFGAGSDNGRKQRMLQDIFLSRVREAAVQVTMFLVNGVMLQGRIAAFDQFCMMLEREGYVQLAYKHAVSTIQPAIPVDLSSELDEEEDDGDGDGGE